MRRVAIGTGVAACLVAASGARSAPATGLRPTLLLGTPAPIRAFAADGAQMAWLRNTRPGCAVFFRAVAGGAVARIPVRDRGYCPFDGTQRWLALGGTRALWALATSGHNFNTTIQTAARQRGATVLRSLHVNPGVVGDSVGGVSGDGRMLVYAVDAFRCTEIRTRRSAARRPRIRRPDFGRSKENVPVASSPGRSWESRWRETGWPPSAATSSSGPSCSATYGALHS
jgi:hypothetical protein